MILRRSSSRCSRKLMAVMVSCACPVGGTEAAISGILGLGVYFRIGGGRWLRSGRHRPFGRTRRGENLVRAGLDIHVVDLGFDLRLELVAGPFEFVEGLPDLPSDLRQFLRPKDNKGKEENEDHLWKAEIHSFHDNACRGWQQSK